MAESIFKVGDKVRIKPLSRFHSSSRKYNEYSNPDCEGVIIKIFSYSYTNLTITVEWDNNFENKYDESDLELVEINKKELAFEEFKSKLLSGEEILTTEENRQIIVDIIKTLNYIIPQNDILLYDKLIVYYDKEYQQFFWKHYVSELSYIYNLDDLIKELKNEVL